MRGQLTAELGDKLLQIIDGRLGVSDLSGLCGGLVLTPARIFVIAICSFFPSVSTFVFKFVINATTLITGETSAALAP